MINSSGPILVPIGFAEQSIVALEQAVNIAKITDSELLLTVVEEPSSLSYFQTTEQQEELADRSKKLESLQKNIVLI